MRRVQSNTLDVGIDVHLKNWSTAISTCFSWHNLTLPYKRFRIRRFRNLYVFAYKDEITLDTPLSEETRPQ